MDLGHLRDFLIRDRKLDIDRLIDVASTVILTLVKRRWMVKDVSQPSPLVGCFGQVQLGGDPKADHAGEITPPVWLGNALSILPQGQRMVAAIQK